MEGRLCLRPGRLGREASETQQQNGAQLDQEATDFHTTTILKVFGRTEHFYDALSIRLGNTSVSDLWEVCSEFGSIMDLLMRHDTKLILHGAVQTP